MYLWITARMETSQRGKDISNCNTVLKDTTAKQTYTDKICISKEVRSSFRLFFFFFGKLFTIFKENSFYIRLYSKTIFLTKTK